MKMIKYTRHAKKRMRWRQIEKCEIESVLQNPEFTEPLSEDKTNIWVKINDRFLRVTYKEEDEKILIISAVKKKKGWG